MNWKVIFIGGICLYIVQWLVSMGTGPLIHEGVLTDVYKQTASFWRPELNQDPPDMAALMPRWIATGLFGALVAAGIYSVIRGSFSGAGWLKGVKFGLVLWLFHLTASLGWSGVFNLPMEIWGWWIFEALLVYLIGGAVLGWVSAKVAPEHSA